MEIKKINHIGIVVPDLKKAMHVFTDLLGMKFLREEVQEPYGVIMAFYQCGEVLIEVMEPIVKEPMHPFLQKYGGGIHHICYEVDDIDKTFAEIQACKELWPSQPAPKLGAGDSVTFFLDSKCIFNIETEFAVPPEEK